jgi:hypothetical protein
MRKFVAAAAAVAAVGAGAAVAYAQGSANQYSVEGNVTPAKGATKAKPLPVELKFSFQVKSSTGGRPAPIKTYSIGFYGGTSNGGPFPKCTPDQINAAQSDSGCPKGSLVGSGTVKNVAGSASDPTDTSIPCNLSLKIYNAGVNRAALYLQGDPPDCVISIHQALDGKFVSAFGGKGQALQFDVPANLLHPIAGLDNAQSDISSTINKITKKVGGKTQGYFQINQACPANHKAPVEVTFTTEDGNTQKASDDITCRP